MEKEIKILQEATYLEPCLLTTPHSCFTLVFSLMEELRDTVAGKLEATYAQFCEEYGRAKLCTDIKKLVEQGLNNFATFLVE